MTLRAKLENDVKDAMRARDEVSRDTLRMVLASIKRVEIDQNRDATDEDVLAILKTAAKTRNESIEQFAAAGRAELVAKEKSELAVVQRYLPTQMGESDAKALVCGVVGELGASSKKDMGRVMKEVLARAKGQLDGKLAQKLVGELLP